jgi:hypothetical protein
MVRALHQQDFCPRDGFPIIEIDGQRRCSVEYADGLIGGQKVIGLAEHATGVTLLLANGRAMPLTEPGSGEPLVARAGMLPELRALLIGRAIEGFRHGEWVSDGHPQERHPIFALQFSGSEPVGERTVEISFESVKQIHDGFRPGQVEPSNG